MRDGLHAVNIQFDGLVQLLGIQFYCHFLSALHVGIAYLILYFVESCAHSGQSVNILL